MTKPTREELEEAVLDAASHLTGLVSAYENYVGRYGKRGMKDPFFKARIVDYQRARDRVSAIAKRIKA